MVKKTVEDKPLTPEEKRKRIQQKMAMINKKAGKNVIQMATESSSRQRIPFSDEQLNKITGGGIPRGAFSVLWGDKQAGKTSTCYDIIHNAQQMGLMCMLYDYERSYDPAWAAKFGVDPTMLTIAKFSDAEAGLDNLIEICKEGLVDLIIVDSVQGLCPIGEYENKAGKEKSLADDTMALIPRRLSKFFPKAAPFVDQSNCAVVMIGQTRKGLGSFVVLDQLTGGNALLHWSSLTMHCRRGKKANAPTVKVKNEESEKNETIAIGYEMVAKVDKSKVGADEGKEARLSFYFGSGFNKKEIENES